MLRTPAAFALGLLLSASALADTVVYVPGVASAPGRDGAYWRTFLELNNPDATRDVTASLTFLRAGADNRTAPEVTVTVPAHGRTSLADVVGTLLRGTGGGALRIRSASTIHVTSRTETSRAGALPAGVEIPGATAERASADGVVFPLSNRPGASGLRTNVGFLNPGTDAVTVDVRLLGSRLRASLGETRVVLPPLGFTQLSDIFATLGAASLDVEDAGLAYVASGSVLAFATVISNATGEGSYVAASPGAAAVPGVSLRALTTVTRVPDATFKTGNFCRLSPLPGTKNLVLTFGTGDYAKVGTTPGPCADAGMGYGYKVLDENLAETGASGMFRSYPGSCAAGDASSVAIGNDYYFLTGGMGGWSLTRYDLRTFAKLAERSIRLTDGKEASNDMMLSFVGGKLDASDLLAPASNAEVDPYAGFGTFHKLFSLDLESVGEATLTDPPHINGSSLLLVDGTYHLVTSTAFWGDLVALRYDATARFVGRTFLASRGQWSQGAVFDGARFWVAWVDVSRRGTANIVLSGFDARWNPVASVPVTRFASSDHLSGGRPGLLQVGDTLYVSYDVEGSEPQTFAELRDWACRVSSYRIEL